MKEWLEYAAVWLIVKGLGVLPRPVARGSAYALTRFFYAFLGRLQKTVEINLRIAFPGVSAAQRKAVVGGMLRHLGWMAAEFARFPKYSRENIEKIIGRAGLRGLG
jgi:KDO2-lipid IV(A) lauroyltransferase